MKKLLAVIVLAAMSLGTISTSFAYAAPYQTTQHLKKDGTPDKRFKENKTPKATTAPAAKTEAKPATKMAAAPAAKPAAPAPATKMKKDGTPDKRFKDTKKAPAPAKKS